MEYYIVIPAHNEALFLEDTLASITNQTLAPKKVIIVNDNSTDDTELIIDRYTANVLFIKVNTSSSDEHLPGSKVIHAFSKGLALLDEQYDFIVKLDADVILPKNYFEEITALFKSDPKIGIAGGFIYEKDSLGAWKLNHPMHKKHVRGAIKAYSKACFKAIGGLKCAMGWDTVDELLAQYHGFTISTKKTLQVKHLRPTGDRYNKKAKLLQGKAMFTMRYGVIITCIASLKMAWKQGKVAAFFDNMKGYFRAKKTKEPFLVSSLEGQFIRALRWKGIKKQLF